MRFPIKFKLAAIVLAVFVPLLLLSIRHFIVMLEHDKEEIKSANLVLAENIADNLDNVIGSSFAALRSLSRHPAVIGKNSRACDRLFGELLPSFPAHLNILAAGMDGNNYGSGKLASDARKLNYNDREWFVKARAGAEVVGDLHVSKLFEMPAVMIALPVFDEGKRQSGVIGMSLNLPALRGEIAAWLPRNEGSTITVVDFQGNVLMCTGEEQNPQACRGVPHREISSLDGSGGSLEEMGPDGVERLYSYAGLSRAGWRVISSAPRAAAYHHAYEFGKRYILLLLLVSLLALVFSYFVSAGITANLRSLITGLREMERGNLTASVSVSGHDELRDVEEAFNQMTVKKREAEQKLRQAESFSGAVLEGIGEGVVVIGKDYRILSANQGYCDQVGMVCDAVVGRHCYEISHHYTKPCHEMDEECSVRNTFETGVSHRVVHTHADKDHAPVSIETISYPLKDAKGAIVSVIEVLTNVSERVKLERDVAARVKELENFYELAVGRELWMVKLKEEIATLREELNKCKSQ